MRRPPKKYGSALGTRNRHSVCQRVARDRRNRFEQARVDAAQAERRVGDDREDRHDSRAQDQRDARVVHPDDDQRRDRDDRRHLQQDRVRKQAHLDPAALHEQRARSPRRAASRAPARSARSPSSRRANASSSARSATSVCATRSGRRHEIRRESPRASTNACHAQTATIATTSGASDAQQPLPMRAHRHCACAVAAARRPPASPRTQCRQALPHARRTRATAGTTSSRG